MVLIYIWPNGTWCFDGEVWKPEPGFILKRIPETWDEARIDRYVQQILNDLPSPADSPA